ncbi:DTW domain-containing protein [Hydrogenovibrio sp. 3SP14C1]|uniref:tRNA-uridine aminocarboxypropyltransferase n=1 Tax=Hydrogenovibrio sp. 3SP14C1 TaxID=3038774 RepID=UPI002415E573|nr:tRNA-uridine aminocarboxypropyltransferase [Hydrogenovibrio sp. 3SP14C1]MDG4813483.1 DTW domain-containing protein [Hydrogenovibrio sp. 3SP14C1]
MPREKCPDCLRLKSLCLCHAVTAFEPSVEIIFLQHPLEQNQVKGTAFLTHRCLQGSQILVGERFSREQLSPYLDDAKQTFLLYPPEEGTDAPDVLSASDVARTLPLKSVRVLVLDGTWRKTRKMLFLNPELAALPRIQIHPNKPSVYSIRKQKNAQSFSTLEAIKQLLIELDPQFDFGDNLDQVMTALIRQQKQFQPS